MTIDLHLLAAGSALTGLIFYAFAGAQWTLWHMLTVPLYTLVFLIFSSLSVIKRFVRNSILMPVLIILIVYFIRKVHRNLNHQQNQFRWSRMELPLFLVRSKEIVEYELLMFESVFLFFSLFALDICSIDLWETFEWIQSSNYSSRFEWHQRSGRVSSNTSISSDLCRHFTKDSII